MAADFGASFNYIQYKFQAYFGVDFKCTIFKHKYPEVGMPPTTTKFKQMNIQA
jgi:hypothetical protein